MNRTPLLIDIGPLSCCASDSVLEDMHKALHDDDHDIWRPHESPFIRDLIEKWTSFGLDRLGKILAELMKWIKGGFHKPSKTPVPKPKMFVRWGKDELEGAKLYLEALPPEVFTLDDWMMVVDYLVQKYLPQDVMMDDAKWQVTRASMMGRVQKHMPEMAAVAAGAAAAKMPVDLNIIQRDFGMTSAQKAAIDFGQHRCCQYVANVTESSRVRMKLAVVNWKKEEFEGVPSAMAKRNLEGKLLDEFAVLNKDWRRIALTEAANMSGNGFIGSLKAGTKVKRMEQYAGACDFCRKIDGTIMTVVPPDKPNKNWDTEVWSGKDNHTRSSSPYRRVGGQLVKRGDSELAKIVPGAIHPHCRGRFVEVASAKPNDDPKFSEWLKEHFAKKKG